MCSFVQFGTEQLVKIVNRERIATELLETYAVSGSGYDIKQAEWRLSMNAKILKYWADIFIEAPSRAVKAKKAWSNRI